MVRVGGVGTKGDDRRKARPLAAVGTELRVDKLGDLAFGHAGLYIVLRSLVYRVVDAGRLAHEGLLLGVLAGAAVVHAVAGQHDLHTGVGLHQRDQKLSGPLLVNAQRLARVHDLGDLRHGLVRVGVPDGPARRLGHIEQSVQKQHRLALGGQVERQQTLIGFHGDAGQIPHALGVADDHLRQSLRAQGSTDTVHAFGFQHTNAFFPIIQFSAGFIALLRYCWGLWPTMAVKRVEKLLSSPKPTWCAISQTEKSVSTSSSLARVIRVDSKKL